MKQFIIASFLLIGLFTACKQETKEQQKTVTEWKATSTAIEGSYEGAVLGYQIMKVKLNMDQSAVISKAKAKDNAVATLGNWELNNNVVTITSGKEKTKTFFRATQTGLIPVQSLTDKGSTNNLLKKQ